jgi:HEAT repeat protein
MPFFDGITIHPGLLRLAMGTAVLSVALAVVLFFVKIHHWRRARILGVRRAEYIAAVGEIVARGLPHRFERGWAQDPLFHDVLLQYVDVVAGDERTQLEQLISSIDLRYRLVIQLKSARRTSQRMAAAAYLAVIASPEIEWALIEALDSPNAEIRIQAAGGLAKIKSEAAIAQLVHMLLTDNPWVAARIADQLVAYGPVAVPYLMENVRDEHQGRLVDPRILAAAVRILGMIGDLRAAPAIEPLLEHPDREVRIAAAAALGSAGTGHSIPPLLSALDDRCWEVRAAAASALAAFSDGAATEPVARLLTDRSWWVRQNAAAALMEIVGGMDALITALEDDDAYARDAALQQLGLNGQIRAARKAIDEKVATEQQVRLVAAVLLPDPIPFSQRPQPVEAPVEAPVEDRSESETADDLDEGPGATVTHLFDTRAS